jgi:hypothetical protein
MIRLPLVSEGDESRKKYRKCAEKEKGSAEKTKRAIRTPRGQLRAFHSASVLLKVKFHGKLNQPRIIDGGVNQAKLSD